MNTHRLKTVGVYWDAIAAGEKLFEVRRNDRFFQAGDIVELARLTDDGRGYVAAIDYGEATTSHLGSALCLVFRVGPVLQGGQFGIEPGYCVFSLLPLGDPTP